MTRLDRDGWSFQRCDSTQCSGRKAQLTIDERPHDRRAGKYIRLCWQCYWGHDYWKYGPIVNCGAMWDGVDAKRGS